jgi:hypothetical protein
MLRLLTGDSALFCFLDFCRTHEITVQEAAVHGEIEQGSSKISFGGDPDIVWGGSLTYPWMSRFTPYMVEGKNHLGLGYKLVILAMTEGVKSESVAARRALGFPDDILPMSDGGCDLREMCKYTGTLIFNRILDKS